MLLRTHVLAILTEGAQISVRDRSSGGRSKSTRTFRQCFELLCGELLTGDFRSATTDEVAATNGSDSPGFYLAGVFKGLKSFGEGGA
jgi:hypothetical protein